jgi:2-dehydropantoate 2-reductase
MNATRPTIAVIGAGAVGGYYGARLAQHGHSVHFLLRSDYEAVCQNGLTVESCAGNFRIPAERLNVHKDAHEMPKVDQVLVALKTTANDQFEPLIGPLLKEDTAILTIQNGLGNEDRLAELFGASRILGGMAFVCINRAGPGVIRHIDHGVIRLGEFNGGPSDRASAIAELFNASQIPCQVLADLRFGRWSKLIWNIPFNGLGAVLDLTTDRLLDNEPGMRLLTALMEEVVATTRAIGIHLPPDIIDVQIRHTRTMGAYRSSMQIDRQERRPLEVESILGEPLRQARRAGVPAPNLAMLYEMACLIDRQIAMRSTQ